MKMVSAIASGLPGIAFWLLLAGSTLAEVSPAGKAGDTVLLRNFAVAQCVRASYDDPAVKADAADAIGAYVEFGSLAPEAYEKAAELAKAFASRSYAGKNGGKLQLMKCLDLLASPELADLVKLYVRRKK